MVGEIHWEAWDFDNVEDIYLEYGGNSVLRNVEIHVQQFNSYLTGNT
jgi:hypothetical protein